MPRVTFACAAAVSLVLTTSLSASAQGAAASTAPQPSAAASLAESAASAASAAGRLPWTPPSDIAIYAVPLIVLMGSLLAILAIRNSLAAPWSLADALSEEVALPVLRETTIRGQAGSPDVVTREPVDDPEGKPVLAPVLKASSSRVIALMGMVSILLMFIGFGAFALYGFGRTGRVPESIDEIVKFLAAGMTLFAPYAVNKFASLFQRLTGGK